MAGVFDKLNLGKHTSIVVMDAPESFEPELAALQGVTLSRQPPTRQLVAWALAFVPLRSALDKAATQLLARAEGDAMLWFAYPKKSSKRYRCDFDRDSGWDLLRAAGWDSVRMVAIDEDWSALRWRKMEYVKR